MARRNLFPEGKKETIQININKDFKEQTKAEIKPILEKYHLRTGETVSELIKRIQQMNLSNSENEALKSKK